VNMCRDQGFELANADSVIVAEKPKLAPHLPEMKKNIASTAGIAIDQINIKATTTEKLGFTGREEGIAAYAVALMVKNV
ncbi:MAG: 2-C-methyl-D-erythritol 2,4-cyclodiphosphate synthase, partial [Porticoccaceae bacterium]|nr:2-C-methyl-D-erythritol 2,4-cyclodiphosphate synthase [Porticoccaceae bacterium]